MQTLMKAAFGSNTWRPPTPRRPSLMGCVSASAVALSIGLAGIGVAGETGWASPLAAIGTGFLLGLTLLTEIAASRMLVAADEHAGAHDVGGFVKAGAALAAFSVFTAWNLFAGHLGATAIDRAGLADKRGPLERTVATALAERDAAVEALAAFDARAERREETLAAGLRGAFEAGYVSASTRSLRAGDADAEARRDALTAIAAEKRAVAAQAQSDLDRAPSGRPGYELWAPALVLELLKGALVWLTARRRAPGAAAAIDVRPIWALSADDRRALSRRCASILASIRHHEARLAAAT